MITSMEKPLSPTFLPAEEAHISKKCKFCFNFMDIKQINLTVAVRQCYQCSIPLQSLDSDDVEFFHRSYQDIHKNPLDWDSNLKTEEEELEELQLWIEKFKLNVSKYEDDDDVSVSSCNDLRRTHGNNYEMLSTDFAHNVYGSQVNSMSIDGTLNERDVDELEAALTKASQGNLQFTPLPFSFDEFFLPQEKLHEETSAIPCSPVDQTDSEVVSSEAVLNECFKPLSTSTEKGESEESASDLTASDLLEANNVRNKTCEDIAPPCCVENKKAESTCDLASSGDITGMDIVGNSQYEVIALASPVNSQEQCTKLLTEFDESNGKTSSSSSEKLAQKVLDPISGKLEVIDEVIALASPVNSQEQCTKLLTEFEESNGKTSSSSSEKLAQMVLDPISGKLEVIDEVIALASPVNSQEQCTKLLTEFDESNGKTSSSSSEKLAQKVLDPISGKLEVIDEVIALASPVNSQEQCTKLLTEFDESNGKTSSSSSEKLAQMVLDPISGKLEVIDSADLQKSHNDMYEATCPHTCSTDNFESVQCEKTSQLSLSVKLPMICKAPIQNGAESEESTHLHELLQSCNINSEMSPPPSTCSSDNGHSESIQTGSTQEVTSGLESVTISWPSIQPYVGRAQSKAKLVYQHTCDCKDDDLTLPSHAEAEYDNQCMEFKLPHLPFSYLRGECAEVDFEEICASLSDIDKALFTSSSLKKIVQKVGTQRNDSLVRHALETVSELSPCEEFVTDSCTNVSASEKCGEQCSNNSTFDAILVTVPADTDITADMLSNVSFADLPIYIEGADGSVPADTYITADMLSNVSFDDLPICIEGASGSVQACLESELCSSVNTLTLQCSNVARVEHNQADTENVQNQEAEAHQDGLPSDVSGLISAEYNVMSGNMRVHFSRSDGSYYETSHSDAGLSSRNCVLECVTSISNNTWECVTSPPALSPVPQNSALYPITNAKKDDCHDDDDFDERSSIFLIDQPLRRKHVMMTDDDDEELKAFTGAKFTPGAKRNTPTKTGKIETEARFLHLLEAVQREISAPEKNVRSFKV